MVDARKWQVSVHTAQPFALRGVGVSFLRLEKSAMETTEDDENRLSKALGINVRRIRQLRGLTQEELAFSIGSTAAALSRIESGRANFTVRTLCRIADALQADPVSMLTDRGEFTRFEETRLPDTVSRESHPQSK